MNNETRLKTSKVFLDTSIFVKEYFNWDNINLSQVRRYASAGVIQLYTTDLTKKEIEKKVTGAIEKDYPAFKNLMKTNRILKVLPGMNKLYKEYTKEKLVDQELEKFRKYFLDNQISEITMNNIDLNEIINLYFEGKPPFGSGKKKSEFPDAFVIASLKNWCKKNNEELYVVSGDNDFKEALRGFNQIIFISDLSSFLDLIPPKQKRDVLIKELNRNRTTIEKQIIECFQNEAENFIVLLSEIEGEIVAVSVEKLEIIDNFKIQVIDVNKAFISTTVKIDTSLVISFEVRQGVMFGKPSELDLDAYFSYTPRGYAFELELDVTLTAIFNNRRTFFKDIKFNNEDPIMLSISVE